MGSGRMQGRCKQLWLAVGLCDSCMPIGQTQNLGKWSEHQPQVLLFRGCSFGAGPLPSLGPRPPPWGFVSAVNCFLGRSGFQAAGALGRACVHVTRSTGWAWQPLHRPSHLTLTPETLWPAPRAGVVRQGGVVGQAGAQSVPDKLAWVEEVRSKPRVGLRVARWAWPMVAPGGWPVCWGPEAAPCGHGCQGCISRQAVGRAWPGIP